LIYNISLGVAYVEFFSLEGVTDALNMGKKPFILNGKEIPFHEGVGI